MFRFVFYALLIVLIPLSARAACTGPAGDGGDILYNSSYAILQWCDGANWIGFKKPSGGGSCDTTPTEYTTPGTYTYTVPGGCDSVTLEAYGAGGAGSNSDEGGAGGGGGSVVERTDATLLVAGGGGGGGGGGGNNGGGGGGYGTSIVSVTGGEDLSVWVGGGGIKNSASEDGGGGGAVSGGSGGSGSGGNSTYGGGGGGGGSFGGNDGGDSTYGGGGGGAAAFGGRGTSTYGGRGGPGNGGSGEGGSGFGDTTQTGSNGSGGTGGAAADGGPGNGGNSNSDGSNGKIVIAPAESGGGGGGCTGPTGDAGDILYNSAHTVLQWCDGMQWIGLPKPPSGPTNCASIGDTCDDGSIYAGLSPDGDVPMYTTPADAASTYTWNDGTSNYTDTAMANCANGSPGTAASCQTGEANTAFLAAATGATDYPFAAAEYCDGLSAHGYDDWYLPAQDELNALCTNKNTGDLNGTFDESWSYNTGNYWSSSERGYTNARGQRFSDCYQSNLNKPDGFAVRCVRKGGGATGPCSNPAGDAGDILYNDDYTVLQWCDGNQWIALPK